MGFPLSYPTSKFVIFDAIYDMRLQDQGRRLGSAMDHARKVAWGESRANSSTLDNRKLVVVLSNGLSDDDVALPAQQLKDIGAEIIFVGVKNATSEMASPVASKPDKKYTF